MSNPNAEIIQNLRDVADWLCVHPELPKMQIAIVSFRPEWNADRGKCRSLLQRVALALGDRATEGATEYDAEIRGKFDGVTVLAAAPLRTLSETPMPPAYEPILKAKAEG